MQRLDATNHNVPNVPQRWQRPLSETRPPLPMVSTPPPRQPDKLNAQEALGHLQALIDEQATKIQALETTVAALQQQAEAWKVELERRTQLLSMSDELVSKLARRVTLADLLVIVEDVSNVPIEWLQGPCRSRNMAWPRQMYCWLARRYVATASFPIIAEGIGGRDHSTIMHAVRAVDGRLRENEPDTTALRNECVARVEALMVERETAS